MNWITAQIKWIMLVSGVLTCTMLFAAIAPQAALQSTFGGSLEGPLAEIVVRNWGALIALMGAILIYGAFTPIYRPLILLVAGVSKVIFISLVLIYGQQFLAKAGFVLGLDTVFVVLFFGYLLSTRQNPRPA